MANKKSISKVIQDFNRAIDEQQDFVGLALATRMTDHHSSLIHELSLIKIVSAVELLVLDSMITVINRDSAAVRKRHGIRVPAHMANDMCAFLIVRSGCFGFGNRDVMLRRVNELLPKDHWLMVALRESTNRESFDRMMVLRHFASHGSDYSRHKAKEAAGAQRLASAGAWLRSGRRFPLLLKSVREVAVAIDGAAPY